MTRLGTSIARIRRTPGFGKDVAVTVGLFALGAIVLSIILVNQRLIWPWEDRYIVQASFESTPGISPGNGQEVRIAGVPVGAIVGAEVDESGRPVLTLSVDPSHAPFYDNATMVLRPKSPLNEMYIEVDPGGPPGQPVGADDVIVADQTRRPIQLDEVLQHLDQRSRDAARILLSEADVALARAGTQLPDGVRSATDTVTSLQPVVDALDRRNELVRELVGSLTDVARAAGQDQDRIARLAESAQITLGALADNRTALEETIRTVPGLADQLRGTIAEVDTLTDELDPVLANISNAGTVLPDALDRVSTVVDRLDTTVDLATPVVEDLRPLVADARPLLGSARVAVDRVLTVSPRLDPVTAQAVDYLSDLQAFVYQTNSVVSTEDANGPILRGLLQVSPESLPVDNPLTGTVQDSPLIELRGGQR